MRKISLAHPLSPSPPPQGVKTRDQLEQENLAKQLEDNKRKHRESTVVQNPGCSTFLDSGIDSRNLTSGNLLEDGVQYENCQGNHREAEIVVHADGEIPDGEIPDGEIPHGEIPDGEIPVEEISEEEEEEDENMANRPDFAKLKIPYFNGKPKENLTAHFRRLEVERRAYGWEEPIVKRVLAYFLGGSARDWYDRKQEEEDWQDKTWDEIKEEFKKRFESETNNSAYEQFCSRKQKLTERPMDFFDAMAQLRREIDGVTDKNFILRVQNGLLAEPRRMVKQLRPQTIEDLEKHILGIEEALELVGNTEDVEYQQGAASPGKIDNLEKKIDRLESLMTAQAKQVLAVEPEKQSLTVEHLVSAIAKLTNPQPGAERRCYRCNEQGHYAAECGHNQEKVRQCYRCGESSHVVADCTAKEAIRNCYTCGNTGHFSRDCAIHTSHFSRDKRRSDSRGPSPDRRYRDIRGPSTDRRYRDSRGPSPDRRYRDQQRDQSYERAKTSQPVCQVCDSAGHKALKCPKLHEQFKGDKKN